MTERTCPLHLSTQFCYNLAHSDGAFVSHCSIRNEWDFPYGTYDECQVKNQRSGKGCVLRSGAPVRAPARYITPALLVNDRCAVHFTRYMNSTIRSSVDWSYVIIICEVSAIHLPCRGTPR